MFHLTVNILLDSVSISATILTRMFSLLSCPSTCVYCPSNGGERWGIPTTNPALRGCGGVVVTTLPQRVGLQQGMVFQQLIQLDVVGLQGENPSALGTKRCSIG